MSDPAYEVKTVDRLVAVLNSGDDGAEATRQYRNIMDTLASYIQEHGGKHKGELTLKIAFTADAKGLDVQMDVSSKLPKRPVLKERFFMSPGNVMTLQDPARDSLFPGADLGRQRRAAASE